MTDTTQQEVDAKEPTASNEPLARSSTRRMAREPDARRDAPGKRLKHEDESTAPQPRGPSKIAMVAAMLERREGATLAEMVELTGWLPHTTRAALTGLKKKGRAITKVKRGDLTCYHIAKVG